VNDQELCKEETQQDCGKKKKRKNKRNKKAKGAAARRLEKENCSSTEGMNDVDHD
jgi:hypothetical protein